jgi:hypothetical protein
MQDIGQADDFNTAWSKASEIASRDQDLFGSSSSSGHSAWWTSCTICKMNFRYKEVRNFNSIWTRFTCLVWLLCSVWSWNLL